MSKRIVGLVACMVIQSGLAVAAPVEFHVSLSGVDTNPGSVEKPFRTLYRAQEAVRGVVQTMEGDVVVNLAPGAYRLDRAFELTEADSGRNGFKVIYRSAGGPGKARLLGSMPLIGWKPHRDGIWKIGVPKNMVFHTLYEDGKRAWKARFPDYEHHPEFPTARGRYLLTQAGTPAAIFAPPKPKETSWLTYAPEDAPPATSGPQMKCNIFARGIRDWTREIPPVKSIDPETRRVVLNGVPRGGIGANARFFLEDGLGFLDAPGEFFLDEKACTLYYLPMGEGHPDKLGIAAPVLRRLIQIKGKSRDERAENIRLEGLALAETDAFPCGSWWRYPSGTRYTWGSKDGALVWMGNAADVEIRDCHLKNSGRSGIMMIGENTGNVVAGCRIEHMGVNGVTLCNRFRTEDRCTNNRVVNCHIHHVGELYSYAACVNVFNAGDNEIGHCELHDSVRYAVTLRGNASGAASGDTGPVRWASTPPAKGNRFHHLRVYRCNQDSGDTGVLHAAGVNWLGGGCVNTFEQITVADAWANPSLQDPWKPAGIYTDWPKQAVEQVFRDILIVRVQHRQFFSNGPDNYESARMENVSWLPDFDESRMEYDRIGLRPDFPKEYGGGSLPALSPPSGVQAKALGPDRVLLSWQPGDAEARPTTPYAVFRDGVLVKSTLAAAFEDHGLTERTVYRYTVARRAREFAPAGPHSPACEVRTPADATLPALLGALAGDDGEHVWVAFSEPVDPATAGVVGNYRVDRGVRVLGADPSPNGVFVRLRVSPLAEATTYRLAVRGVTDRAAARNSLPAGAQAEFRRDRMVLHYPMDGEDGNSLRDASGNERHARLKGGAAWAPTDGRTGGGLVLDGEDASAEGPADFELGDADFTIAAWIWKRYGCHATVVLAKGGGSGSQAWSWGEDGAFRVRNAFFSPDGEALVEGRWQHLAFVRRGNVGQAYVDGRPSGAEHDLSVFRDRSKGKPLLVGRRQNEQSPRWFEGKLDDVRIYDRALAPWEIGVLASLR